MIAEGHIDKMVTRLDGEQVQYQLPLDGQLIDMNGLLGQQLSIAWQGKIHCMNCGKQTRTSFAQGYCYQCYQTIPETEECVLNPEKCKAHLGISRDLEWAKQHCLIEHFVYLSFTSQVKVGVTRHTQIPTRWIDQGAVAAIKLASVPNRHIAGLIEVFLKNHYSDKTQWQQMLISGNQPPDMVYEKNKAFQLLPDGLKKFLSDDHHVTTITYPMTESPQSIKSINLENINIVEGRLTGIKGQYFIFDNSTAINIRSHRGYLVAVKSS